jgi:hypothetical protein
MKNTVLIIILLGVCLFLFKKTNEGFDSITKNELVNNMDETKNKMKRDYKVFNDETAIMATDQYNKFMILSIITILVLIGTIVYAKI